MSLLKRSFDSLQANTVRLRRSRRTITMPGSCAQVGDEKANTGPLRRELAPIVRENPAIALIERLLSTPDGAAVNSENSAGMTLAELRLRWGVGLAAQ